ncbi:uncharacterized protein LOC144178657 [Haemaphysalis longicornis]
MPPRDMLTLVGRLQLRYGLAVAVNVSLASGPGKGQTSLLVSTLAVNRPNEYDIQLLLQALNPILRTTTTLEDVLRVYKCVEGNLTRSFSRGLCGDTSRLLSVLGLKELDVPLLLSLWKPLLVSAGAMQPVSELTANVSVGAKRALEEVTASQSPSAAVAYVVVKSMEGLYEMEFVLNKYPPESLTNMEYCERQVESLRALWAVATSHRLRSLHRNAHLSQVVSLVKAVIVDQVRKIVLINRDVNIVKDSLERLRLRPFSDVMDEAPLNTPPVMTPVYWNNALSARAYAHLLASLRGAISPGTWWTLGNGLYDVGAMVTNETLYVSGALYSMVHAGNDTDAFASAALIGVHVANAIWKAVFAQTNVSDECRRRLRRFQTCASNRLGTKATGLEYALLSIQSAADAVKSSWWNSRVVSWHGVELSSGQIFYMVYFVSNICSRHLRAGYNETLHLGHWFMRRVPDFAAAYGCRLLAPLVNDTCGLR